MSTLSKLFVVMILVLALVLLGVNATLFAMRADFKHKWVEESRHHYQTQMIKSAELAESTSRIQLLTDFNNTLKAEKDQMQTEINSVKARLDDREKELQVKQTEIDKLAAGVGTLARVNETQQQSVATWEAEAKAQRERANAANSRMMTATQDLQYRIQEVERLSKDLGSLENQYQEIARERQRYQEVLAALNARGIDTNLVAPRKALAGQVTAVATELDLVVISIGRDAGVNEGDEFTVYRGNTFVGKITVDRVDRAWASGRVTLKGKEEPRIGDQASNNVLATPGKSGN
jgi:flagellar biosynthesis GTPase FlhF